MSYPGHSLVIGDGGYLSAEMQSVYYTASADWPNTTIGLCRLNNKHTVVVWPPGSCDDSFNAYNQCIHCWKPHQYYVDIIIIMLYR